MEEGIEGLKSTTDRGNQGPNSELDKQDRKQLIELLEEGAQAHGWETDLWTSKRVAALIERELDIDFTPRHCSRILHELGYRPVKLSNSKKADRRRDDSLYRRVAVPPRPSHD
ncbi:MAG: winged helix-turn-helix domain-containing protein [Haloarcula sp.]